MTFTRGSNITWRRINGALAGLVLLGSLVSATAAPQLVRDLLPAAAKGLPEVGRLEATNRLRLGISLPLRNREALTNLLRDLYDPASPSYRQFLTPEQFAERFGPTEADYQALIAYARAGGFTVAQTHPNRTLLEVEAAVPQIEQALHTTMRVYRHPRENRNFHAPSVEPSLNAPVKVLGISGLNNYSRMKPRMKATPLAFSAAAQPNAGSGISGLYMGNDFRAAYLPGSTLTGTGQKVALVQFDGYTPADITYYESQAGLPAVPLLNVLIGGATGAPSGTGGEIEVTMDIQMVVSMAPGLSQIIVYMAPNPSPWESMFNRIATDNLARQVSCSWYSQESSVNPAADQIFQQMAAQGQSFFQASGDYGGFTGRFEFPGESPYITLVGGTKLTTTGPGGARVSETTWNEGGGIGSAGGISTNYTIPAWQAGISMAANQGSTTMRNVPDIALTADDIYVRANGVDYSAVGTSASAPLWAGFCAIVNQRAAAFGRPPLGFINPAVYALTTNGNYATAFHDITTGNNTTPDSPTRFYAATGFDLCTGLGTPKGLGMVDALVFGANLGVPASATEGNGVLANAGSILLSAISSTNLVVTLASSDSAMVQVPASVTVLAGHSNAVFDLTIVDDLLLEGTQTSTITAFVPGLGSTSSNMVIYDNESATLQMTFPATVTENQEAVTGTVTAGGVVAVDTSAVLTSTSTNLIQLPSPVTIPAGTNSVTFVANVLSDGQFSGQHVVTLRAHVDGWADGTAAITVLDDLKLKVRLPASALENAGVLAGAGSVAISGPAGKRGVSVSLSSGSPSRLTVPSTLTIPSEGYSNSFNITVLDNASTNGSVSVNVIASATSFINGTNSMVIVDNESSASPSTNQVIEPRPDGSVRLSFTGTPWYTYRIQYCDDLSNPVWQVLGTRTADASGNFQITNLPPVNATNRFYRAIWP